MALNTLSQILNKKGHKYIDNILSKPVIITEKLDTYRIQFEKVGNKLVFYKKNNNPIDLIERTLTNIWEDALIELPILIENIKIPEGIRFGLAYTPVERPLRIPYKNLPKYILTDMSNRKDGKILESYDYDEITKWAGLLCVARPPIIFEGVLTKEQKSTLINYSTKNFDNQSNNLSELSKELFGNKYSNEDIIEGLIIKSDNNLMQIISYEFDLLNEAYKNNMNTASRDFYDIIFLNIINFLDNYKFPNVNNNKVDEGYIKIINDMFIKYANSSKINENIDPSYLTPPRYGQIGHLNKTFIKNSKVSKLISKSPIYEALYRVFLSSFRKYKKPYGLLNEQAIDKFNTYVGIISNILSDDTIKILPENNSLNEQVSDNVVIKTLNNKYPSNLNVMKIISSIQSAFNLTENEPVQGENKCAIYLTTFSPFTDSQMSNIKLINDKWKVPVIIATVSNEETIKGKDFHPSVNLIKSQMQSLSNFDRNMIPNYILLDTWSLLELYDKCRPKYEPVVLITDIGKKSDMTLQLYFEEEVKGKNLNVLPEFNIGELENKDYLHAYRTIEDGNGAGFMEITPNSIHNFYDSFINEYKVWDGSIIPQFKPSEYTNIN